MCSQQSERVSCGLEPVHVHDLRDSLHETSRNGYDFTCTPLVHPRFVREHENGAAVERPGPFTRPDLLLSTSDWSNLVVGLLTPSCCSGCDSENTTVMRNSEASLLQELTLASHLSVPAVMVRVTSEACVNLARLIYSKLTAGAAYLVWVRVPMQAPVDEASKWRSDMPEPDDAAAFHTDTWHWWNRFHSVANIEKKIGLCLEVSADLPEPAIIDRWLGEPVRCTVLPTSIWLTNKKGFPVLSSRHQSLVRRLHTLHSQFLITGHLRHPHLKFYQQYLDHIITQKSSEQSNDGMGNDDGSITEDALTQYARGYEDYLQCPLQPLMDNLESQTYEVFEKDPVKYQQYEAAIYQALVDRVPEEKKDEITIVVMVVGAGRGPLVRRALVAASQAERRIRVYAVEKNPNAVLTLHAWREMEWGDKVTVVSSDMRDWKAPELADVLVSELLGSFGDNELSPECLDGAQKFLKDDGISIPSSYTSSVAPLQSAKLYNEIRGCREKDKHHLAHLESPYVVYLHNKREIAPPQDLFTFHHPNRDSPIDNRRHATLQFRVTEDAVLHGLAGYFETTLYKDITLSIRPDTHSPGMFSWFPILFPIKEPMPVQSGCVIEVHFWRCVTRKNVWYEWCVTSPNITAIHNPNGRAYTIGL